MEGGRDGFDLAFTIEDTASCWLSQTSRARELISAIVINKKSKFYIVTISMVDLSLTLYEIVH